MQRNTTEIKKRKTLPEVIYPITEIFSPAFLEARKKKGSQDLILRQY